MTPLDGARDLLSLQQYRVGDEAVVLVAGELDLLTTPELEAAVMLESVGSRRVTVDLTGVTFMDSSGLRGVLRALEACQKKGTELAFTRAQPQVERVLELAGVVELPAFQTRVAPAAPAIRKG